MPIWRSCRCLPELFPRVRAGAAGPPVPGCSISLPKCYLGRTWRLADMEHRTDYNDQVCVLWIGFRRWQRIICLEGSSWKVIDTISRSLVENFKNIHEVFITVLQRQRRTILARVNVDSQSGAVDVSEVSPNKRHWVTEALSLTIKMEIWKDPQVWSCRHGAST